MRLTGVLQLYIRYRRVPGLLRFGKHRVIPPISISLKRKVAEIMVIEKTNVDILNKPYLSKEQEEAYHSVVPRVPHKNEGQLKDEARLNKLKSLRKHVTTGYLLSRNLNKTKQWE